RAVPPDCESRHAKEFVRLRPWSHNTRDSLRFEGAPRADDLHFERTTPLESTRLARPVVYERHPTGVRAQHFRNPDGPIGVLKVLQDGDQDARQGQPATVERMHELRLSPGARSKADVGTASLEVAKVRARAYLQPLLAARRPHLYVELASRREAQVSGAHLDDAMPQTEPPAHVLGVVEQRFELRIGFVGQHE